MTKDQILNNYKNYESMLQSELLAFTGTITRSLFCDENDKSLYIKDQIAYTVTYEKLQYVKTFIQSLQQLENVK